MEIILELVVKDIQNASSFYTKYLDFEIDFTQYEPVAWMQLKNGNTKLMLVTYDFTKSDINGFKEYTPSTNLYKFCYDNLEKLEEISNKLKKDNKNIFLDLRKADYRYELGD